MTHRHWIMHRWVCQWEQVLLWRKRPVILRCWMTPSHSITTQWCGDVRCIRISSALLCSQLTINVVALLSVLLGAFLGSPLTVPLTVYSNAVGEPDYGYICSSNGVGVYCTEHGCNEENPHREGQLDFIISPAMRGTIYSVWVPVLDCTDGAAFL